MKIQVPHFLLAIASLCLVLPASAAVVLDFETGFTAGQTAFTADGLDFSLTGNLAVTNFATFGSGGGNWFVDTGNGSSRSGNVGSLACNTANMGFVLSSLDLWTSNNGGNLQASGHVTLTGVRASDDVLLSTDLFVAPAGFTGEDCITFNDLSALNGVTLKSVSFNLGTGLNYLEVDRLHVAAAIPEPSTSALLLGLGAVGVMGLRRRLARK